MRRDGQPGVCAPFDLSSTQGVRALSVLHSISHAVEICVLNSIEAGAREIHVEVDVGNCSFSVSDDGCGVRQQDLALLGAWNATSKGEGFRGEGLAAICNTAVVEVRSRAQGCFETHSCLVRGGEALQLRLAQEQRPRSGTTVTVKDMFYNRPVIRKAIAAAG